jgi:hypothetical protein
MRRSATRVFAWDPSLVTERRDETAIEIALREARAPKRKEKVDLFARFLIARRWLRGTIPFPGSNRLADDTIDRLRKGGARLVDGDIEQAHRV